MWTLGGEVGGTPGFRSASISETTPLDLGAVEFGGVCMFLVKLVLQSADAKRVVLQMHGNLKCFAIPFEHFSD